MFKKLSVKLCVFIFCIALLPQILRAQETEETIVARVSVRNFAETMRVAQAGLDLMEYRDGEELIFWTTRKQFAELQKQGFVLRVDERKTFELQRDLQTDTFRDGYRTVEETRAFLNQMQTRFPNLAQVFTYGQSWEKTRNPNNGYDLFGVKLTNRQIAGDKPTFLLQAGIHARELVPPEIAMRFVEYLLTNYGIDADATWILDEHQVVVIPIVNPDGRKLAEQSLSKRKNTNNLTGNCTNVSFGIDLNRNFSFLWGTVNLPSEPPCSETFPGSTAASEPETQAVEDLVDSLFPDQRGPATTDPAPLTATGVFLDMHSTGNLVLYPWGQDNTPPPNLQLRTIARKMAAYNGYNPIQSIQLYPTSGTAREYAYGERGAVGLAMEIGSGAGACGGFFAPFSCLDGGTGGNFWGLNRPALLYLAKIARTPYMTSEGATTETLTVSKTGANYFALRAQISDAHNGGQTISAAEVYVDTPPSRGGTPVPLMAEDGAFNSAIEFAVANLTVSPGRHIFYVRGRDAANNWGAIKAAFAPRAKVNADFDGDGRTDVSVFRPSNGVWYIYASANNNFQFQQFGSSVDKLAPADYDGDGKTDLAVYRGGTWYVQRSQTNSFAAFDFGAASDVPVAADYDGDGKADIAVYRGGTWYILRSADNGVYAVSFGTVGDLPTVGDYDGDGKSDVAVFRPSGGIWYSLRSAQGFAATQFGVSTDKPVPADYDGDGKTDVAVYRGGIWYLLRSQNGFTGFQFGQANDAPAPGDFDGDGLADAAVYRQGFWYILQTTAGFRAQLFGVAEDKPLPSAYLP